MKKYIEYRKEKFCNLHLCGGMQFSGEYDMPVIRPYSGSIPDRIIPFNLAMSSSDYDCGVHYYIDDYQFERVWRMPERYISKLRKYKCVIAPDYSVFLDTSVTLNAWTIYRSSVLAYYFQQNGIEVIPNMSVSFGKTKMASIEALPDKSVLSVCTLKANHNYFTQRIMRQYIREVIDAKHPTTLMIYGHQIEISAKIPVFYYENSTISRMKQWNKNQNL